jgi:hypothetical protein
MTKNSTKLAILYGVNPGMKLRITNNTPNTKLARLYRNPCIYGATSPTGSPAPITIWPAKHRITEREQIFNYRTMFLKMSNTKDQFYPVLRDAFFATK